MSDISETTASKLHRFRAWLGQPVVASFIGGGCAGAVSRTVVSPFERMKIIFQVQGANSQAYQGMLPTLAKMWREEGWRGYMRGNGINCIRIVPYSAVQFCTYTVLKNAMAHDDTLQLTVYQRLTAGALAGIASVCATYPMDIVRTRLSIQTASISPIQTSRTKPPGMWETMKLMYKTEGGFRALWRGLIPTTMGVAPYVGINFAAYEWLRDLLSDDTRKLSTISTLVAGALSGAIAQTFTYPFDVLRRRFQVNSMGGGALGFQYESVGGALRGIVEKEGFKGLYKGLGPNLWKVAPSMASSFLTFEAVKRALSYP